MSRLGALRGKLATKLKGGQGGEDRPKPPADLVLSSTGHFATQKGSQYLQQLCKHFGHDHEVSYDERAGRVTLYSGMAHLTADERGLTVKVEAADVRGLLEVRYVVDKHLAIFAFRDKFAGFAWSDPYA